MQTAYLLKTNPQIVSIPGYYRRGRFVRPHRAVRHVGRDDAPDLFGGSKPKDEWAPASTDASHVRVARHNTVAYTFDARGMEDLPHPTGAPETGKEPISGLDRSEMIELVKQIAADVDGRFDLSITERTYSAKDATRVSDGYEWKHVAIAAGSNEATALGVVFSDDDTIVKVNFYRATGEKGTTTTVDLELMTIARNDRGSGKKWLRNIVRIGRKLGMEKIELLANLDVGGYAWARFGFQPKTPQTKKELADNILGSLRMIEAGASPETRRKMGIDALKRKAEELADGNGKALWTLADARWGDDLEHNIGKNLLLSEGWDGVLRFDDAEAMQRLSAYVNP